jgi:hypothetical protein
VRRLATLLIIGLALGCQESPEPPKPVVRDLDEGENLLSLRRGATVIDRSGEMSFNNASMHPLDGHPNSMWASPPGNLEQWMVAELPVKSRIEAVGLSLTSSTMAAGVKDIRFEHSLDGADWTSAGTFEFENKNEIRTHRIEPADARYLRISPLTNHGHPEISFVPTIIVRGEEVEAWVRPSVAGHWMLNDLHAHFREQEGRVYGRVELDPPMWIEGGWNDRIVRFAWIRGRSYGVGFLSVNPEGVVLNGLWWYENIVDFGNEFGGPWFGTRIGEAEEFDVSTPAVAQLHLERDGRFPLFGLIFDEAGELDAVASGPALDFLALAIESFPRLNVRLDASHFHSGSAEESLEVSRRRADSLRAALVARGLPDDRYRVTAVGSDGPYPWRNSPLHWTMYSRVDFSLTSGN